MFWVALTLFLVALEAALRTAPQEFWTQENIYTMIGIGVGTVILYFIIMKGKMLVVHGKDCEVTANVQISSALLGLVASAGIAAGIVNLAFKNIPETQALYVLPQRRKYAPPHGLSREQILLPDRQSNDIRRRIRNFFRFNKLIRKSSMSDG